jgi:hypothetical protein
LLKGKEGKKKMKTIALFLLAVSLFFMASSGKAQADNSKTAVQDDFFKPNAETKYITMTTSEKNGNSKLLSSLAEKLKKDGFSFQTLDRGGETSFDNCSENVVIKLVGKGTKNYYARSKKPVKNTRIYPDFHLGAYEFSSKTMADEKFKIIEKAYRSQGGYFCNGKQPRKLVRHGNVIYSLTARAEMFSTELEKYGNFISNFQE